MQGVRKRVRRKLHLHQKLKYLFLRFKRVWKRTHGKLIFFMHIYVTDRVPLTPSLEGAYSIIHLVHCYNAQQFNLMKFNVRHKIIINGRAHAYNMISRLCCSKKKIGRNSRKTVKCISNHIFFLGIQ